MAVIYLGRNNKAKKIDNLYVGINSYSKQVVKGYIGVNGYSKLFFNGKFYPTLRSKEHLGLMFIDGFNFNDNIVVSGTVVDENTEGTIYRKYSQNLNTFHTKSSKIYLGKNCSQLFNNYWPYGPRCADYNERSNENGAMVLLNLEKYFLFNKVEDLSNFFRGPVATRNYVNVTGNLANCNFINIINMAYAFYGCTNLRESPQCGPNVIDMTYAYCNCNNLTKTPKSGPNVTNMRFAYYECTNITGDPACGPNVYRFDSCYGGCRYLGKNVNIGEKVTSAVSAYMRAGTWNEGLYLNNIIVGKYSAIDLSNCFRESNVDGDICILNNSSNITYIFNYRTQSTKIVNIHYPITESITQLNSKLSSVKITSSSEIHKVIDGSYIDICKSSGASYNIRIYADYIES